MCLKSVVRDYQARNFFMMCALVANNKICVKFALKSSLMINAKNVAQAEKLKSLFYDHQIMTTNNQIITQPP